MPAPASIRLVGVAAVLLVTLSGCFGGGAGSPQQRIGHATQTTLDDLGLRAGLEMFNDAEGFAQSYSILVCAEVADDITGPAAAEQAAEIVNALREMTAAESDYVNAVQVRLVPESAGATKEDLNTWCREQWPERMLDFSDVADLFSSGDARGSDFEVTVPYDEVTILEETPTP